MTEGKAGARLRVLAMLVLFMFIALTTRLWFLQVMASERFRSEAEQNAVRLVKVEAPRGRILDFNGNPIVDNQPSLQVVVDRDRMDGNEEQILFALSNLLRIDVPTLTKRLESNKYLPYAPVPVAFNVSKETAFAIGEYPDLFGSGAVDVVQVPARQYLYGDLAAHILGYIGPINDTQYGTPAYEGYEPNDVVGQAGLESQYESYLRGDKGSKKLRINASGVVLGELGKPDPPVNGDDIRLNIDVLAQQAAEHSLELGMKRAQAAGYKAGAGTVVILEPSTGAVKAIVSLPAFNPAIYNGGLSEDEMVKLGLGERKDIRGPKVQVWHAAQMARPLFDRALDGEYAAGSTIKPFVAMSALRNGFAREETHYSCAPSFTVPQDLPGREWKNWAYPVNMGYMNLREAIVQSCDTVFYHLGYYKYWTSYWPTPLDRPDTPREIFQRDLQDWGFGHSPGIDFPSASSGLVPDNAWKRSYFSEALGLGPNPPDRLYCEWNQCPGDFINMSVGQGNLRVTPLQLAVAFSAIATDGKLCQPRLAATAETVDGRVVERFNPSCRQIPAYTKSWYRYVRQGMAGVPTQGTASAAFAGFPFGAFDYFGGKTGTAEVAGKQDFSWFGAIARGEDKSGKPHDYVVVAMVEEGGHGSDTAAPIVRDIVEELFGLPGGGDIVINKGLVGD